jgi:hypothetical protein
VPNYLIRVQLPDRPGALGAVASRIGAVGADVVSIDILQQDGGVVVDDLGINLANGDLIELLRGEILEVDGVSVEAVRALHRPLPDRNAEILKIAIALFGQTTSTGVIEYLVTQVRASLGATFAAALGPEDPWPLSAAGDLPGDQDLRDLARSVLAPSDVAEAAGADQADEDEHVAVARLAGAGLVVVVGRPDLVFRTRERQRVAAMGELADHRWLELSTRSSIG